MKQTAQFWPKVRQTTGPRFVACLIRLKLCTVPWRVRRRDHLCVLPSGGWEMGPDLERLHLFSTSRNSLKLDKSLIVCVFFGADHMGFHTCSVVLSSSEEVKRFVDERRLFAFHLSQNIFRPMLRQSEEALAATTDRNRAIESDLDTPRAHPRRRPTGNPEASRGEPRHKRAQIS